MKRFFSVRPFKKKLFASYAVVGLCVVFVFAALLIGTSSRLNRETEVYHQQQLHNANVSELEQILSRVDQLATQVISNTELLNFFVLLSSDEDDTNYFSENLLDGILAESILTSLNGTDAFAARICIYNQNGDFVATGSLYETEDNINAILADKQSILDTMELLSESPDRRLILGPQADRWSNNPKSYTFTVLRAFSPAYTAKVFAILSIEMDINVFSDYPFFANAGGGTEYLLVNTDGSIIYAADAARDITAIAPELLALGTADESGEVVAVTDYLEEDGVDKLAIVSRVEPSDWLLCCLIPTAQLNEPYLSSYYLMIAVCFALLVLMLLATSVTADYIAKPLTTLSEDIGSISLHNISHVLTSPQREYTVEELRQLDAAYRQMLVRINKSISFEMKAYLRALQSQMNPHFLYNMLSAIVESGEEENSPRTVAMCMKLTDMMRYIADYNNDRVTFERELQHARNYLDLMKERYETRFDYAIHADEDALSILVPKLIVQPLAENCFKHGFSGSRPPWRIDISLHRLNGKWELTVQDNGVGITQIKINEIHQRIVSFERDMSGSFESLRADGMGLINSILRLTLLQNTPPDYEILNLPGGGTIVRIGGEADDSGIDR
ncbi:MAG TPA: histidine kinase [Candidatus Limiplasma sp.]|nr:histidine kinase [Candidatus Limiplasma sp.]